MFHLVASATASIYQYGSSSYEAIDGNKVTFLGILILGAVLDRISGCLMKRFFLIDRSNQKKENEISVVAEQVLPIPLEQRMKHWAENVDYRQTALNLLLNSFHTNILWLEKELPQFFEEFTFLKELELNKISQINISTSFDKLEKLIIDHSTFSEEFDWISFSWVKELELRDCLFKLIPSGIYSLSSLKQLIFRRNQLRGISAEISALAKLELLDLSQNHLKSVAEINLLTNLKTLTLSKNYLESVPDLNDLTHLESLDLSSNKLTNLAISELQALKELDLSNNQFDHIPKFKGSALVKLDLSHNQIKGVTDENVEGLNQLKVLNLSHNQIEEISEKIATCQKLEYLNVRSNQIKKLPDETWQLTSLNVLALSFNLLSEISSQIENLKNLTKLELQCNLLREAPHQMDSLRKLKKLDLSHNKIELLSLDFFKLDQLLLLNLSNNRLKFLPFSMIGLKSLKELHLNYNQLREVPSVVCLTQLQILGILGNHSILEIPSTFTHTPNFQTLICEKAKSARMLKDQALQLALRKYPDLNNFTFTDSYKEGFLE